MIKLTTIGILGGTLLVSLSASAQEPAPVAAPTADPALTPAAEPVAAPVADAHAGGPPPITGVRAGGVAVWGTLGIGASKGLFGKPLTLSPDVYYGVSDVLSVGLAHSSWGTTGFVSDANPIVGRSLCLSGKTDGCPKLYNNVGFVAKYALSDALAVDGGVILGSLDPMNLGIKAGVVGRVMAGPVMVMYNPNLYVGVNKRDLGNKEWINVPVMGLVPAGPVMAGLQTGIYGPLSKFGDSYGIPLSLVGIMQINQSLMGGASLTFNRIAGKGHTADFRTINLFVGWNN